MYHHTPEGGPEGFYDVGLQDFRDQIRAMRDAGIRFIKFSECGRRDYVERGRHVAITFDDGHATNAAAFQHLADHGITPTAFLVRDWATRDGRYLSPAALRDLADIVEFGGHGASHRALSSLSPAELADELAASRRFVEDVAGRAVDTMALPGGHGGSRELEAAARAGFRLVGNSRPLPHVSVAPDVPPVSGAAMALSVNRICINRTHDAPAPLRLAQAGAWRWGLVRARFAATSAGRRLVGRRLYGALAALAK